MAVKYRLLLLQFDNFARIPLGMVARGFLRSLLKNFKSESQNSK